MIKYAYIHPTTREYLYEQDREKLIEAIAQFAADVYTNVYCNGALVTIVEVNEDGSETWRNATGEEVINPQVLIARLRSQFTLNATDIPVTVVGG